MGFSFVLLLISLVHLSRAKDLRPVSPSVDRRSAPDALLSEIFNDPGATSLTKLIPEDSDSDIDDISGSGSELWSGSGDQPQPSKDSSTQSETVTPITSQQTAPSTQTETTASLSTDNSDTNDNDNSKDNTVTSSSDSTASSIDTNTPYSANSPIDSTTAQNAPQQSSTNSSSTSSPVTSQGADANLPSSEEQSQNSVVQTEENDKSFNDTSAPNADIFPTQTSNTLETVADNPEASLVSQLATQAGFDDSSLYDPTIVKKTNVPVALDALSAPVDNNKMDTEGQVRSSIPQAPVLSPKVPAVQKSTVAQLPYKGSFPLRLHKYSPYAKLLKKGLVPKPGTGTNQQASKKSVVPALTDAGGLRPLLNMPQQQQDPTNPQGPPQAQAPNLDANQAVNPMQMPFGDQLQAPPQTSPQAAVVPQSFAPVNLTDSNSLGQNPQQALDQVQGGVPQAPEQAFAPQAAAPSDMQAPGSENVAAAFPMNSTMNNEMFPGAPQETAGIPAHGAQVVPVYQGLKAKKPLLEEDECEDMYETCPEMKKNFYCTNYTDLMKIQCKKSCGFCEAKKLKEESESGYDESGSTSLYYADEMSGSGSSDWRDDDDYDEDEEEPGSRKSGIPQPIHKVLMAKFAAGSGSGSGSESPELDESSASDDDISEASGSGEMGSGSQKKDEVQTGVAAASGSGEATVSHTSSPTPGAAEIGSGSGSHLAEDLATGTVSRFNEKHSSIPRPPPPAPQVSVYPKIDLKEIAKAVNMYRGVALKMLGEALEGAAEQKEEELAKKSHIPLPPATGILQQMGFPIGYDEGSKRNMIPNTTPVFNPMDPNYGMLGYGNNGYVYNYPQAPALNEPLADFYGQYQQQPNMARSDIMATPGEEPPQSDDKGAAQAEQPEEIQPVTSPADEAKNATAIDTEKQDKPQESQNKTTESNSKKSEIVDPFEYVRNMGEGASMEPIRSKTASNFKNAGHSDPLILWKNSQSTSMNVLAEKKSSIPIPASQSQSFMPAFTDSQSQFTQGLEQPQFRSDIPQQNATSDASYMTQADPAPVFQQYTPQGEALTQNPDDGVSARSQITQTFAGQQPQEQGIFARLTGQRSNSTSADSKNTIPQSIVGTRLRVVSHHAPLPGSFPLSLRKIVPGMAQKKDELYKQVQEEIKMNSVPSGTANLVTGQVTNNPAMSSPVPQPAVLAKPGVSPSGVLPGRSNLLGDNTETAAASINEALTSPTIISENQHSADPLFASLNSQVTSNPEVKLNDEPIDNFFNPEVQISGKIPSGGNSGIVPDATAASRAEVSKATGNNSPATEKGIANGKIPASNSAPNLPPLNHLTEPAQNLPPLNYGTEMAGALPPLNHNVETASSLPPLNHAKEEAENLPPLMHGIEQAASLPPLNHGNDAVQSFHSLPPLNHGTEQAENLPPLNHGIETNSLPPLNHANEQAGVLPPLLHGVEQAKNAPNLDDFEKQSAASVDALSAFTSQTNNDFSNKGKQPLTEFPLHSYSVLKDSEEKLYNAGTAKSNLLQPSEENSDEETDSLKNYYYSTKPVVQEKEFIDRQPYVVADNKQTINSSKIDTELASTESYENAQSKDSVPSAYNDEEEHQKLLDADRMSQGVAKSTSSAVFENKESQGDMLQSYVGKPPLTPPLEHAYPQMSHQHAALLPPLNHQELPPLNHNNLLAAPETSRYTGSDAIALSSQGNLPQTGQTRTYSKPAPPIYPFTIPPEGEQENQGYHGDKGRNSYHETPKAGSDASARGFLQSSQLTQFYPVSPPKYPQQAVARQWFPEGGNPYPIPLPPEGGQNDPIDKNSAGYTQLQRPQEQRQPFDSNLLVDPETDSAPQLTATWKKGNSPKTTPKPCEGDEFCPYPLPYPMPLPPEGQQEDQLHQGTGQNTNPIPNIGKKNLIRPKPDLQCGAGWTGALGDFGSFCYQEIFEHKTWDNAHQKCKSLGGELFSVTNAYEQRFLENFTNIESWLGYRDQSRDGTWSWSDSSLSVFTNWDSSAKNDNGKGRDCVLLNSQEGKWKDASCSQTHEYLCKKNVEDCNKGWKKLTLNSVQGCYKLFKERKTWEHALVSCMDEKASLASILSDDEETMISQVYSNSDFWIGYNDIDNEGDWVWSDRTTSSYTNWDDKSPNNGGVSCAILTSTGKWHDEPCQSQYSFICKKPSPKGPHHPLNDATLTHEVEKFVSNKSLPNPDIDTSVTIFGRHSVTPQYLWTVQKISDSRIHGSNPIAAHGNVKAEDGGLQLNGIDAWLDAGDFYGQCLGDPDLCIKGFSFALQLNFDDDALSYKDKRYILDSSGNSRGVSIFIQNGSLFYKVVTSTKEWQLFTELVTNEWQDIAMTWKKEEGLMLYVNGAFRDSLKEGTETGLVPNKQARLTIGRKSGNPPYKYTRMYISSLYAFTRFLAPEDVPYVFTFDNTVVPRYMWLLPILDDQKLSGSPDIEVNGPVRAVDGGVHLDGKESYLKVGNFDGKCLHDPAKCPNGLSLSCKLKFNRVVRSYKEPHYILDSGGHQKGTKGLSAYLLNNNLYFSVAMSTDEDTLTWTVRTSIFTVRWQRVVLSWSLSDGLWLYTDSQFRGWTKTPKSVPRDVVAESADFVVGRKNVGPDFSPAEFSIGSLAVFPRFLEKKDVEKVFGGKKMPYPGLIREVWKELAGKSISQLKDDPYYPNDPSLVEIIENFDSPFDIDKDYGSKVKGYFVAPETGNYTFYMSGSQSGELWMSSTESQQNLTKMISLDQPTGHNQWNKYAGQSSRSVILEAGKYYYVVGLQKGTESTDSLSAGVRLPSGRFMRPITKEILQWRLPGDPFAGVIRELWQDIPGYKIMDLTSNPNFPNNPSSIEVLDKFDAPHNVDDNYGSRIRGFFKAPESGLYRFFLAADTTGELWLSSDETEKSLKKVVAINGWTAHNEWLKFPEQKSERIHLKKGKYYYMEAYQKADKLADCVSVAVELPSGHFEGPIKRVHLSWRLPDGRTGPGPSSQEEAIPKPVGLYPLNKAFGGKDAGPNNENGVLSNVDLSTGPNDDDGGAYEFKGTADSFVEIPNDGKLDTQNSMTILANIYPSGSGGPILNYKTDGWGVHLWQFESTELFVRFVHRNGIFHKPIASRVLQLNEWNQVGATYDNTTGVAQLWHNGKMVKSRNIGQIKLATQYPIRIGARDGDDRRFAGKISCLQIYDKALDEQQIGNLKSCPVKAKISLDDEQDSGFGSGSGDWDEQDLDSSAVSFSHNAGKYDKDEEADDEIQGSESYSGNKCEPQPCENGAKCIRDSKRLDGYRCKCTSDFTGRNCQVSKPDAENPVVKRAKIPKPELKTGSEGYQKNASSLSIIENIPEEKKQDVLLLFQKVGCYKDESVRHDLPDRAIVKSVSQEDCVRSCALEEKGYSYFGLQNSDTCYCGHRYGKYGKADEANCNMPCTGNDKENCGGNSTNMVYFFGLGTNYTISSLTGDMDGADTDANVYITLYGEKGDSGFRKLDTKHFSRGKNENNTLMLPDLGKLRQVRILHDNSGSNPSWFLEKITVTDENGQRYEFPCKEWLSETQGGGKTERLLRLQHT